MGKRRGIGILMAAIGGLLIAASGIFWSRQAPELGRLTDTHAALKDSVDGIHAEIVEASVKQRGFQGSISSIPDSLRKSAGKQIMDVGAGYNKQIRNLEMRERDLSLKITAIGRRVEKAKARAVTTSVPLGISGVLVFVTGLALARASRSRPVGA